MSITVWCGSSLCLVLCWLKDLINLLLDMAIRPSFRPTVCCSTIYHIVKYSSASVSSDLKALYKSVIIIIIIIIIIFFFLFF